MNEFSQLNLFAFPIYKIKIDPTSYDKEKIIEDIKYNKNLKKNACTYVSIFGNDYKENSFERDYDGVTFRSVNFDKLNREYTKVFNKFFDEKVFTEKPFRWELDIRSYSAILEGQRIGSHNHLTEESFSTCHYVNFKKEHVFTRFNNPANFAPFTKYLQVNTINFLDLGAPDNSYLLEDFTCPIQEDDMIIFPSTLNHEVVEQGPTKEPRITISTNIKIK